MIGGVASKRPQGSNVELVVECFLEPYHPETV